MERVVKREEIPGDTTFPDTKSEPDKVSYFCKCLLLETFYQFPGNLFFFVMSVFLAH